MSELTGTRRSRLRDLERLEEGNARINAMELEFAQEELDKGNAFRVFDPKTGSVFICVSESEVVELQQNNG